MVPKIYGFCSALKGIIHFLFSPRNKLINLLYICVVVVTIITTEGQCSISMEQCRPSVYLTFIKSQDICTMLLSKLPPVLAKIAIFPTSARRHLSQAGSRTLLGGLTSNLRFQVKHNTLRPLISHTRNAQWVQRSRRGNVCKKIYVSKQIYSEQWSTSTVKPILTILDPKV